MHHQINGIFVLFLVMQVAGCLPFIAVIVLSVSFIRYTLLVQLFSFQVVSTDLFCGFSWLGFWFGLVLASIQFNISTATSQTKIHME